MRIGLIKLSFAAASFVFLFSCVNTKRLNVVWVFKKQNIYETISDSNGKIMLVRDSIIEPLTARLIKRDSFLSVKIYEGKILKDTLGKRNSALLPQGVFFPYTDHLDPGSSVFAASKKLVYISASPVFQALTIPVKVRLESNGYPYEAEASINLGVAWGWKFTHHVYHNYYHRKTGEFVNSSENRYSITPGVFAGPGVVELTTRNSTSSYDRNVLTFSYGAVLVFGINRLNVGVALGFDDAVGNADKVWIYQNKPWIGATISFDLIQ